MSQLARRRGAEGEHPLAVKMLSGCQQAVNKLSREKIFLPKQTFSSQQTKILTLAQKFTKIKTDESFRVAVKGLSGSYQEAVRRLSGKNHHKFESKIEFGRWFRYQRRAYPTPSVLTPAKFDLHFRLSRGCSPSERGTSWLICIHSYL